MQKSRLSDSVSGKPLQDVSHNASQHLKGSRRQQYQSSVPQSTPRRNVPLHTRKQVEHGNAVRTPDSAFTERSKEAANSPISQLKIRKNRENRRPATGKVASASRGSSLGQKSGTKKKESRTSLHAGDEVPRDADIFAVGVATPPNEDSMIPSALVANRRHSDEKREPQGNPVARRRVFSKVMDTLQGMTRTPVPSRDTSSSGSLIRRLSGKGSRNGVNASTSELNGHSDVDIVHVSTSSETMHNVDYQEEHDSQANCKSPGSLQVSTPSPPSTVKPVRAILHSRRAQRPESFKDLAYVDISLIPQRKTIDFDKEETFWVLVQAEVRHGSFDSLPYNTMSDLVMYVNVYSGCDIICLLGPQHRQRLISGDVYSRYLLVKVSALQRVDKAAAADNSDKNALFDQVLADLEGMLGVHSTEVFSVSLRYKHPLFSNDTHLVVEKKCTIQRTIKSSEWDLRDKQIESDDQICGESLAASCLKLEKTDVFAMITDFEEYSCSYELPPPLANMKHEYDQCKSMPKRRGSRRGGTSHHLPRFSFESNISMSECLEECPLNIPKRSTSYSPSAMTDHTSRSTPDERDDKARHIWHIMRQDSKGRRAGLARNSSESLLRLESTDESLRAIREKALRNKRSVGADTLRSLAVGARNGMGAPWL